MIFKLRETERQRQGCRQRRIKERKKDKERIGEYKRGRQ